LSDRQRYRLIELLDPETIAHYEFFLGRPPLAKADWSEDATLLAAIPERSPCMDNWESGCLFNYDYQVVKLNPVEVEFLKACDGVKTVGEVGKEAGLDLGGVRSLVAQHLILLNPANF
jgi:hypothetical protein